MITTGCKAAREHAGTANANLRGLLMLALIILLNNWADSYNHRCGCELVTRRLKANNRSLSGSVKQGLMEKMMKWNERKRDRTKQMLRTGERKATRLRRTREKSGRTGELDVG